MNASEHAHSVPSLAVDEHACATAIGMSVSWLRKDRQGKRLLPYSRVGGAIRYNLQRVNAALEALEEGGAALKPRARGAK